MINSLRLMALALTLLAVLSGCSVFGNNEPEYLDSEEIAVLKIPEGLDDPRGDSQVLISVPQMRLPAGDELEPKPPRVVSTAGRQDANAHMAWSAEGVYLLVKDTPDSVARRLRFAIDHAGMTMLRRDDEAGAHKFHYSQIQTNVQQGFFSRMAFWRSDPFDYSGTFMTSIRPDGEDTRVYLLFVRFAIPFGCIIRRYPGLGNYRPQQ
jgi:uncharacterized lipoprotein